MLNNANVLNAIPEVFLIYHSVEIFAGRKFTAKPFIRRIAID